MSIKEDLILIATKMGVQYTLHDRNISYAEVFSETGLLPAIARRADQLSSLCLGYGLGVTFDEAEKSVLGLKATFDETTPNVLRYMCIVDVLYEIINAASTRNQAALDELLYD